MTSIPRKIYVIGLNSFKFEDLSSKLKNLIIKTNTIAAPETYINEIEKWSNNFLKQKVFYSSKSNNELISWLEKQNNDVVLISRGDPLWFGIGRFLLENIPMDELTFYPANTCIQLAFSKLKIPWQDTTFISIHGRDSTKLLKALKSKKSSLAIITDSKNKGLEIIKHNLIELRLNNLYDFWLCEEIGFENEKIRKLDIKEDLPCDISDINIVILIKKAKDRIIENIPLFGLNDDIYKTFSDRPNLLTKREIRIQILADLELPESGVIWDIGAGCGSIGLEALKLRPKLKLYCIDKRIGSKNLIKENSKKLNVRPENIFENDINYFFSNLFDKVLEPPSRVVIGGTDKKTKIIIIEKLSVNMSKGDIIVVPIIEIESIKELKDALKKNNFEVDLNLIQTYKTLSISDGSRLDPNNPVFLLRGKKLI